MSSDSQGSEEPMTLTDEVFVLIAEIEEAFPADTPAVSELIAAKFADSDDVFEFATAVDGLDWKSIEVDTLFFHRESLGMLSPRGYCALLGAFIRASLVGGPKAADITQYTLTSLHPLSNEPEDIEVASLRLSQLSVAQRKVIAKYLRHEIAKYQDEEARKILTLWNSKERPPTS